MCINSNNNIIVLTCSERDFLVVYTCFLVYVYSHFVYTCTADSVLKYSTKYSFLIRVYYMYGPKGNTSVSKAV